jgi:hypothetical protein
MRMPWSKKETKTLSMKEYNELRKRSLESIEAHKALTDMGLPESYDDLVGRIEDQNQLLTQRVEDYKEAIHTALTSALRGLNPQLTPPEEGKDKKSE